MAAAAAAVAAEHLAAVVAAVPAQMAAPMARLPAPKTPIVEVAPWRVAMARAWTCHLTWHTAGKQFASMAGRAGAGRGWGGGLVKGPFHCTPVHPP